MLVVKIEIPDAPNSQAIIRSKDGKIHMRAPIDFVQKRMPKEKSAFFQALIENGSLEIAERVPDQPW